MLIFENKKLRYPLIVLVSILSAVHYQIFIKPNAFAPSGLSGFAAMLEHLTGINIGIGSLLLNVPLIILALLTLNKKYTSRNIAYIITYTIASLFLDKVDFSGFAFVAKDAGEGIMAAVAAGVLFGVIYSVTLRCGGSTGGTDLLAAYINKKRPEYEFIWINFAITAAIAVGAFFVYGRNYSSVILCIIENFVASKVSDGILKGGKSAALFIVVTKYPEELGRDIIEKLGHTCTVLPAKGMYGDTDTNVLICVVNKRQVVRFEKLTRRYEGTFTIVSTASNILGNFRQVRN